MLKLPSIDIVHDLFNALSANWETLNADRTGWESNFTNPEFIGAWYQHRETYGYVLRSELVYQFKNLLTQEHDANIDGPINYLIVDEYQDLNRCDLMVVSKLEERGANLFCAGDDDQSIYGFRYAVPEGIRDFKDDIPLSEQFLINECYRCDQNILNFALNVIRQDHRRIPKQLISVTGKLGEYHVLRLKNQYTEAEKIAEVIYSLNTKKEISYDDVIILLRSDKNNAFSNIIISKLNVLSIPVSKNNNYFNLFDSYEGRYLVALLKYIENNENDLAIRTLLQLATGIGEVTIDSLNTYSLSRKIRFSKLINEINQNKITDFHTNKILINMISTIFSYNKKLDEGNKSFSELLVEIFKLLPACSQDFIENINKFINDYEINNINKFIVSIIEYLTPHENDDIQHSGVRVMTMHKTKGLSASAVFVVGVEDETIPGKNPEDEDRRLLYVSLTRARNYLFVTYCNERLAQQQHSGHLPIKTTKRNLSRYIQHIPTLNPVIGEDFLI